MDTEQIFDGSKIYNINTDDMEVTIAKPNGSSTMFSLSIILLPIETIIM
jgi:hypothetical protein